MTLQELRYFCVTAEVLHYTRASRLLYISQPSLSYALNKLEQELGVSLFKKDGKKVTLTKYGEEFLPYAKRALAELSEGTEHLREMKVPASGGINMGYIYSVSFSALPEFVNKLADRLPLPSGEGRRTYRAADQRFSGSADRRKTGAGFDRLHTDLPAGAFSDSSVNTPARGCRIGHPV